MASPSSVRFDPEVLRRLNAFVRAHPGLSLSAAGNLLVDEGLRSTAHPLVTFVDGPGGRRAREHGGVHWLEWREEPPKAKNHP